MQAAAALLTLLALQHTVSALASCPFPLAINGKAVDSLRDVPKSAQRYIISAQTQEGAERLAELMAAALPPTDAVIRRLDLLPMLVARLSRKGMQYLCQDVEASGLIAYVENDGIVTAV